MFDNFPIHTEYGVDMTNLNDPNYDPPTQIPSDKKPALSGDKKASVSSEAKEMFDQFLKGEDFVVDKSLDAKADLTNEEIISKFHKVLKVAKEIGASDVFLKTGVPPSIV